MISREYYNNCINDYRGQIAGNNQKIAALEDSKFRVFIKKKEDEEYLSERNTAINRLLDAKSEGVLSAGEKLAPEVSNINISAVLSNYNEIIKELDRKIQLLRDENSHFEDRIMSCRDEIDRIEKEEQDKK